MSEEEEKKDDESEEATETAQSLTMPTDEGDDQFETIQQEFQEVLAELVKDKSMDAFRGEYEKLFNTLEKSNRNEKRLRTKCKELGSEIAQHVAKVDLTNDKAKEDQDTIESLKKEIEKAWKMVDTAQEGEERARETIETLNTEIQNLTKVIEEKTLGAEDTNINELRKLRDELTQQRDNLQLEVAELKTKFEANEAKVETLTKEKADQEREIGELNQEAQSRNNEMNREMRRKERAERELKQLKGDVSAKEQELSEQSAAKAKLNETIGQLERSGREQKELGAALEADLEAVNEKFSKLQQDHETQMSLYQQLEMELARKSSELSEKEDVEIQVRSEVMMQKKDIDNLGKKISGLEALKTELEHDKEKLKTDIAAKNKEVEELQHQALVTKKDLNILENAKEGVEMKLERSAQTIKNEAFKVLQLEDTVERQQRFISRLEEERDRYMGEGAEQAQRIDCLLEEGRNAETILQHTKKQVNDLKEKMKVLTHQFDQLKEEIIAKEMDLVNESQGKSKVMREKDGLAKDIEKVKADAREADNLRSDSEKKVKRLEEQMRGLEGEMTVVKADLEKSVSKREVLNAKLAAKTQEIEVLQRKVDVQQKVNERGEANYNERQEDVRLLRLEVKRLKEEIAFLSNDTKNLDALKKEVLKLERDLMQQKSRNKVLQLELENPLNVHRWRRLEGKDPETLELIQKINNLQKRLISKQEDLIDKDMKIEEINKLYNESKLQISRQPKYDVHDEIRNLREELKRKNDKILILTTTANMYQVEATKIKKVMEGLNQELNSVKQKYLEVRRQEQKAKETIGKLRKEKSVPNLTSHGSEGADGGSGGGGQQGFELPALRAKSASARLPGNQVLKPFKI